jgi:Subtilase family
VAQANAALSAAQVSILGGLPVERILVVVAVDTADFSGLSAALQSLRADPNVAFAAMSSEIVPQAVPRPADPAFGNNPGSGLTNQWGWEVTTNASGAPFGAGYNWWIESSRFPKAWNLLEPVRRQNPQIQTVIVDSGFGPHPDLTLSTPTVCKTGDSGQVCTVNTPDNHGMATAGTIGATFGNPGGPGGYTLGVDGLNPVAHMAGVPLFGFSADAHLLFSGILDEARPSGQFPKLRVINVSMSRGLPAANYFTAYPNNTYGPLDNDDQPATTVPGSLGPCTLDNEDKWLTEVRNGGRAHRTIAERAADHANRIVFVVSTGNGSSDVVAHETRRMNDFGWAAANWVSAVLPNPIFMAEALGTTGAPGGTCCVTGPLNLQSPSNARASLSNVGGHIAAPGVMAITTVLAGSNYGIPGIPVGYGTFCCTSMAAPIVSGLIGYLLALDPGMTIPEIRAAVVGQARADTSGIGAEAVAPRVDAYASIMSLAGAVRSLVDVNDLSKDGNRRTVRGPGNVVQSQDTQFSNTPGFLTAPDGHINMSDFRRFRDAWLQTCNLPPLSECPTVGPNVVLDGDATHVKKDVNFDGCVNPTASAVHPACPTLEGVYPRFDFNGDGVVALIKAVDSVPFRPTNITPLTSLTSRSA